MSVLRKQNECLANISINTLKNEFILLFTHLHIYILFHLIVINILNNDTFCILGFIASKSE